ncbi:U-box domain-containing protein 18 [Carex littledalei]|uniref:RING-type E3 ubiquitin transferase n=1 Tax=Carex littledalei TaxID=544730 RepID=A0A833QTZ9_9POAL|nr:U-box domain-containing protein 18 [Carex littledalei]
MTHLPKRKFLSSPAVYPCEDISPDVLLPSLISLCGEILAKRVSGLYPIHRRVVLEAVREVGLLLVFFEEVFSCGFGGLPESAVMCLLELHFALQKIQFLLHDCGQRGAQFWILMRSNLVLSEFRVQIRSIATALDVLPLESINVSPEAKELVRLLSMQTWTVEIELSKCDDLTIRTVRSVLNQFKQGLDPDQQDLKRVLDHLQIRNWSDCDDELSFLEQELFTFMEEENNNEVPLLGSLIGFMLYCRVVIFNSMDFKQFERKEPTTRLTSIDWLNPEGLQCPISLELMTDPVMVSSGQTYDRASIKKWIKSGCRTCPVTGKLLISTDLVPNLAIRRLVEQYCRRNNILIDELSTKPKRTVDKTAVPFSPASAGAIRQAVSFLVRKVSKTGTEERRKAIYEMRKLSKSNNFHRVCLVEADAIPWLLYVLSSSDSFIQDNAVAVLLNLSKHPSGQKAIFESGGIGLIIDIIKYGFKVEAKQNAAAVLFYLSSVEEYRVEIGNISDAVPTLVQLLRDGMYRGKKNAAVSLFALIESPENHPKVISAGAVPVLVSLLKSERSDIVYDSVAILEKIAERHEGTIEIIKCSGIARVVGVLGSSTSRSGKEHCVSLLLFLCTNAGAAVVSELGKMPALMAELYRLVIEGTAEARRKARSLLDLIHNRNESEYPVVIEPTRIQDRVIHVL